MTEPQGEPSSALVPVVTASPEVVEVVNQATHIVLGAVLIVSDGIGAALRGTQPDRAEPDRAGPGGPVPPAGDDEAPSAGVVARRVAVGAAFDAQRRAASVADATIKVVGPTVGWLASNPLLRPVRDVVGHQIEKVYDSGLAEETAARQVASRTVETSANLAVPVVLDHVDVGLVVPQVLDQIELGPLIERVVAQIDMKSLVGGVIADLDLEPIVNSVIDELDMALIVNDVLDELDLGPIVEKVLGDIDINAIVGQLEVGSVVLEATGGMKAEIVNEVRNRGADGDALVEIVFDKIFRRKSRPLPPVAFPELVEETA